MLDVGHLDNKDLYCLQSYIVPTAAKTNFLTSRKCQTVIGKDRPKYFDIQLSVRLLLVLTRRTLPTSIIALLTNELRFNNRTSVPPLTANIPIRERGHKNGNQESSSVVHRIGRDRSGSGQDENDADKKCPNTSPSIDSRGEFSHVPWAGSEVFGPHKLAANRNNVGPIQSDGADVEDTSNSSVGTKTNQVYSNAPEDGDPDCIDRGASTLVNLSPDLASWDQAITGEGEDGAAEGLGGGEADELEDDECADGVEDATGRAEGVVENLGYGLSDGRGEDVVRVTHGEAKDDVVEPTSYVGEQHGHGDSPRGLNFGLGDFLSDVGSRIVISHSPGYGKETEKERKACGAPSGGGFDVGENIFGVVSVNSRSLREKSNAAGDENQDVENDIGLGHLLHPIGRKRVDETADDSQSSHHADDVAGSGVVGESRTHGNGRKEQLSRAIFRRGDTSNLTQKIDPTCYPTDRWDPVLRRQSRHSVVEATTGRIRGDKFSDGAGNAHTSGTRNQPAPDRRGRATGIKRIRECGCDGCEKSRDRDGEGERGEVTEFTFEDWLVTKLLSQCAISLVQLIQLHSLSSSLLVLKLNTSNARLASVSLFGDEIGHGGLVVPSNDAYQAKLGTVALGKTWEAGEQRSKLSNNSPPLAIAYDPLEAGIGKFFRSFGMLRQHMRFRVSKEGAQSLRTTTIEAQNSKVYATQPGSHELEGNGIGS